MERALLGESNLQSPFRQDVVANKSNTLTQTYTQLQQGFCCLNGRSAKNNTAIRMHALPWVVENGNKVIYISGPIEKHQQMN